MLQVFRVMSPGSRLLGLRFLERKNWSRWQDSHLLSRAPKARGSTTLPSPRDGELPNRSGSDRGEKKVSWSRLRRTPASAETCAGLSRGANPAFPAHSTTERAVGLTWRIPAWLPLFADVASHPFEDRYSTCCLPSILPDREEARTSPCGVPSIRRNLAGSVGPRFRLPSIGD